MSGVENGLHRSRASMLQDSINRGQCHASGKDAVVREPPKTQTRSGWCYAGSGTAPGAHSADAVCRNVKRWRPGDQLEHWVSSGLLPAEQQFRRIVGYRALLVFLSILDARGNLLQAGVSAA
jgi:hypothetical protein